VKAKVSVPLHTQHIDFLAKASNVKITHVEEIILPGLGPRPGKISYELTLEAPIESDIEMLAKLLATFVHELILVTFLEPETRIAFF